MPTLEILSGEHAGKRFTFTESAKVGKDDTCQIKLTDPGVSRFHAELVKSGGAVQIKDLGSSNGTYVNFKKRGKGEEATLADNDIVFFGRTVSKFWLDAPPERPAGAGVSPELLRETVPVKGLHCPSCRQDIEQPLRAKIREAEQVELIRRLGLHQLDPNALQQLLQRAR